MNKISRSYTGQVRIIGGQWRGRKISVLDHTNLHPTPNRVRETLFNWLAPSILGACCLDCFSGSGALSLEALSRYAAYATLVEIESNIAQQLQKNLSTFKIANATVVNTNILTFLTQPGIAHNIVFIDPPFRKSLLEETCSLLEHNGWLTKEALIYVESEAENCSPLVPIYWKLYREKLAGKVAYRLYHRHKKEEYNSNTN